ncbi:hypothetical protein ACIPY5_12190 [Microbacterium sp. NPDC089698]|uniref:hypothetical protein n=1 Tax=Microbacterium sp. NPDC089698 TaxID=3364200 RepID=UPI00381EC46D
MTDKTTELIAEAREISKNRGYTHQMIHALADALEAEHQRAEEWEKAHQKAFNKEAEMAVRLGLLAGEHKMAGMSWDRTRKRLESEVQTFREQYIPRLTTAEAERDALRAQIEGHGGWDEWIAEHVRVSEENETLRTAIQEATAYIESDAGISLAPMMPGRIILDILSRAIDTKGGE